VGSSIVQWRDYKLVAEKQRIDAYCGRVSQAENHDRRECFVSKPPISHENRPEKTKFFIIYAEKLKLMRKPM
jgi:hypothetical protein